MPPPMPPPDPGPMPGPLPDPMPVPVPIPTPPPDPGPVGVPYDALPNGSPIWSKVPDASGFASRTTSGDGEISVAMVAVDDGFLTRNVTASEPTPFARRIGP